MVEKRKNQKRNFVRLNVVLPVKYRSYTGNPVFKGVFNIGRTYDLSSGGMKLTVSKPFKVNEKLDLELELNEAHRAYLVGKALGGENLEIEGIQRRVEKINFVDIDPESREKIMRFIFEFQRKTVRKDKNKG